MGSGTPLFLKPFMGPRIWPELTIIKSEQWSEWLGSSGNPQQAVLFPGAKQIVPSSSVYGKEKEGVQTVLKGCRLS